MRTILAGFVVAGLLSLAGCATTSNQPILVNAGFEKGFEGWKYERCDIIGPPRFPESGRDGSHMAVLGNGNQTDAYLSQAIRGIGKGSYELQFDFGSIGDRGNVAVISVEILQGDKVVASKKYTNNRPQRHFRIRPSAITRETLPFSISSGGPITIRFSDVSPGRGIAIDPAVDNVAVVAR